MNNQYSLPKNDAATIVESQLINVDDCPEAEFVSSSNQNIDVSSDELPF
jgi:hypothetical protein